MEDPLASRAASPGLADRAASSQDPVSRYCAAALANDMDALAATLADDVELPSPLSGRLVFRGREDLRFLLAGVYDTLTDVRWEEPVGGGRERLAICRSKVAGMRIDDAMVFELDDTGSIRRIRPHLRPWLATTVFALMLGPKVARRPAVLLRALKAR
jgi:hypothetical protein